MTRFHRFALTALMLTAGFAAHGQAPRGPTGSVSGTVIAADTQQPARFALVTLEPVNGQGIEEQQMGFRGFGGAAQARTEADGTFVAANVAPGDYYVTAWAPGYIPLRAWLQAAMNAGADANDLLAQIPVVHVTADSTSSVTVNMQRGGAISGRVVWEDGSPATGLTVTTVVAGSNVALPAALAALQANVPGMGTTVATTDDRGNFRVSGLPSGNFIVEVVIQGRAQPGGFGRGQLTPPLQVYGTGVFHRADAKPISLRAGDERSDVRMVIDLHGLHTVSGHATSSAPGQNVASGRVSLTDSTDPSLQLSGNIDAQGGFVVKYVPPGTYTLTVAGASTVASAGFRGRGAPTGGVSFAPFSQPQTVSDTDLSGVALTLTPVQ